MDVSETITNKEREFSFISHTFANCCTHKNNTHGNIMVLLNSYLAQRVTSRK